MKRGVGRPPNISLDAQIELYKQHANELLDENGKILPATAAIYSKLKQKIDIDPKTMVLTIQRKSDLIFGTQKPRQYTIEDMQDSDSSEEICVCLSSEDKMCFAIEEITNKTQKRFVVKSGWSDGLYRLLLRETNTECCYQFNQAIVNGNGTEILMQGECSECKSKVEAQTYNNVPNISISMTEGVEPHTFEKRRRLIGKERDDYIKTLSSNSAFNVFNDKLNEICTNEGNLVPHLPRNVPSKDSLRKLRHKQNKFSSDESSLIALLKMCFEQSEYANVIRRFSIIPFGIVFYTEYQQFYYSCIEKRERICISIDSTGSLINARSIFSGLGLNINQHLAHVMLYLIVVKRSDGKSIPVGQFLSAKQHYLDVKFFLENWLIDFKRPHEICIDDSPALLKAVVCAFTECSTVKEYISRSFDALEGKDTLPKVFIRLDVAHYVKSLHRNKAFSKKKSEFKYFYLCILGYIMQCKNYAEIKQIVHHVLVAATSQCVGIMDTGEELPATNSIKELKRLIKTHKPEFLYTQFDEKTAKTGKDDCEAKETNESVFDDPEKDDCETEVTNESVFDDPDDCIPWFDEILKNLDKKVFCPSDMSSNVSINPYESDEIVTFFKKQLSKLVLWSAVMTDHHKSAFDIATSSNVESHMNITKNVIMKNVRLPTRPDTFIKKFVQSLNGQTQSEYSKVNFHILNPQVESTY